MKEGLKIMKINWIKFIMSILGVIGFTVFLKVNFFDQKINAKDHSIVINGNNNTVNKISIDLRKYLGRSIDKFTNDTLKLLDKEDINEVKKSLDKNGLSWFVSNANPDTVKFQVKLLVSNLDNNEKRNAIEIFSKMTLKDFWALLVFNNLEQMLDQYKVNNINEVYKILEILENSINTAQQRANINNWDEKASENLQLNSLIEKIEINSWALGGDNPNKSLNNNIMKTNVARHFISAVFYSDSKDYGKPRTKIKLTKKGKNFFQIIQKLDLYNQTA